jgi:DNA polymerase-4
LAPIPWKQIASELWTGEESALQMLLHCCRILQAKKRYTAMSKLNWSADKLYICLLLEHFSAQSISALDLNLRAEPFAVIRQDALSHKSRVWACSTRAQKLGVRRGGVVADLKKKYGRIRMVKRNLEFEGVVLEDILKIISLRSPDFEVRGQGIIMLNMSHLLLNKNCNIVDELAKLKEEIEIKVQLEHIAVGVSASKIVSWIMARTVRPEGLRFCTPEKELSTLSFLNCSLLPGLTYGCRQRLKKYGLNKISQLQQFEKVELVRRFGPEGEKLYGMTRGVDFRFKSKGFVPLFVETIFEKDIIDQRVINEFVRHTADKLCYRLKLKNLLADKITILIRYTDNKTKQGSLNLPSAGNDFYLIAALCEKLFMEVYLRRVSIRSLRIIVKKPLPDPGRVRLIETIKEKRQRLFQAGVTNVRKKFFFDTVFNASELAYIKNPGPAVEIEKKTPKAVPDKEFLKFWTQYQKNFSFLELRATFRREPVLKDFKLIDSISRAKISYTILLHHKISQPEIIDIKKAAKLLHNQIKAAGPLIQSGRLYSFLIRLKEKQVRSLRMLNYLLEVSAVCLRAPADVHIEFSHLSWYTRYVFSMLKSRKIGICNPGFINSISSFSTRLATTDKAYIRYDRQNEQLKKFILNYDSNNELIEVFSLDKNADKIAEVHNRGSWINFLETFDNR